MQKQEKSDRGDRSEMWCIGPLTEMQTAARNWRAQGRSIGLVPTMGALHAAHLELMKVARQKADVVVASIFVNPRQFDDASDLAIYPRDLERDLRLCAQAGVDAVFAPEATEIYPAGFDTTVHVDRLSRGLCGAGRPGHFDGVCTIVAKLFNLALPHLAVFGEKDYQQLSVVRRLVRDLSIPLEVVGVPTLREADGLAMSSRNVRLSPRERLQAIGLVRAIESAQRAVSEGARRVVDICSVARAQLAQYPEVHEEYLDVVHPDSLCPQGVLSEPGRMLVAARVGQVRLIDNGPLEW